MLAPVLFLRLEKPSVADDVIVMKDGEIIESGTVHQIFYNPKAEYTKELLDARLLVDEVSYA